MSIERMKEAIIGWLDELDERRVSCVYHFVRAIRGTEP